VNFAAWVSGPRSLRLTGLAVALVLSFLGACAAEQAPADALEACPTGAIGEVETFAEIGASTEGIAFSPDGRLFASTSDAIWEIDTAGKATRFTAMDDALGLAFKDDLLLVAGIKTHKVYAVTPEKQVSTYASDVSQANFVAVTQI
jgi:hypothetical protein